ncbi:alpha/beta-hydrolase [Annulohypoxylon maeteangense]|uniref:alpha/beta-hydrolase n=1 Tax=Annulohypoxylon maeteangense TaxID=1927788 RepID=UPI002007D9B0|nr:alpha/beta-hydrolase [Annulohypoxylon maeteangense]KAI0882376.1 alpha/beta-hydrolase [Annulohypoxylon maeteangense]
MASSAAVELFTLSDDRNISYAIYGDHDSSRTIFYHHGYPSSHEEAIFCDDLAQQRGIRLISVDRPGMASSTYQPNRRLLDWPVDLLALADHLKVDRFAVFGVSGGGPYAIACWHQIPRSRCVGLGIMSGLYPTNLGASGMLLLSRAIFWTAQWSPWLVGQLLELGIGPTARSTEDLEKRLGDSMKSRSRADREAWDNSPPSFRQGLVRGLRGAFEQGPDGVGWEGRIYGSDWGFGLDEVKVEPGRVVLWHGDEDVNCPIAMTEKAAKLLHNAELRISMGQAHMMFATKADEALETLGKIIDRE